MNCRSGKEVFASPQQAWRAVMILDGNKRNSSKHRNRMTWARGGWKAIAAQCASCGMSVIR